MRAVVSVKFNQRRFLLHHFLLNPCLTIKSGSLTLIQRTIMNRLVFFFYILISCMVSRPAWTQEEFIEPPSQRIASVPFTQLTGGIVIMEAKLNDFQDTLNFILDTGSSGISLDSTTADYLNLETIPTERTIRGIAGIRKVHFLYKQKLRFPGIDIDSLDFHINDYSSLTAV